MGKDETLGRLLGSLEGCIVLGKQTKKENNSQIKLPFNSTWTYIPRKAGNRTMSRARCRARNRAGIKRRP